MLIIQYHDMIPSLHYDNITIKVFFIIVKVCCCYSFHWPFCAVCFSELSLFSFFLRTLQWKLQPVKLTVWSESTMNLNNFVVLPSKPKSMKLNVRFEQSVPLSFFSRFRFFTLLARNTSLLQMAALQILE